MLSTEGEIWRTGFKHVGMNGRRFVLWLSGNGDGGVGVMVQNKPCEMIVKL